MTWNDRSSPGTRLIGCALALGLLTASCAGGSESANDTDAEAAGSSGEIDLSLTLADYWPEHHDIIDGAVKPFMEQLRESGGSENVDIEYYGNGELAGADALYDAVKSGTADIAAVVVTYVSAQYPPAGIAELPGFAEGSDAATQAYWEYVTSDTMQEMFLADGVRPIFTTVTPQNQLFTVERRIQGPGDMDGLRMRSAGGYVDQALQEVGAAPVQMPVTDAYLALEREAVDGTLNSIASILSYKQEEVLSYGTRNAQFGASPIVWFANEAWYQSLSEDEQELLTRTGEEIVSAAGKHLDDVEEEAAETMESSGVTLTEVPPDAFAEAFADLDERWISDMNDQGFPGEDLMKVWRDSLE